MGAFRIRVGDGVYAINLNLMRSPQEIDIEDMGVSSSFKCSERSKSCLKSRFSVPTKHSSKPQPP